jgi:hypothetical protein
MSERLLKEREFKDAVVRTCFDQKDSHLYQARNNRSLGRLENKVDHLITMAEGEVRRSLREQKLEYERQQHSKRKPIKINRARYRKRRYQSEPRKFNGPNHKSRGQRNGHTCEKASCKHVMDEIRYNMAGCAEHMPYDQFLRVASQQKTGMDRLDGVCYLREVKERGRIPTRVHRKENWLKNNEDSLRNDTKLHRCVSKNRPKGSKK